MSMRHPRDLLGEHGVAVKKSFGQNFLVDPHHKGEIARQVASLGSKLVFEIGSGLGALTSELLKQDLTVHAVERDRDMARIFRLEFAASLASEQLILHEDNAMTFDYETSAGGERFAVCGNLPYHLTSTLIFRTLEMGPGLSGAVFMIQREVAERIVAGPGSRDYGILSVLVQAIFTVQITLDVPSEAFWPRPQVDSSVITMMPRKDRDLKPEEFERLKMVVKKAFSQRRKTLRNCLKDVIDVDGLAAKTGISGDVRPETLSPEQFITLMRASEPGHA
jgi:16S rRNA (adenine1518-N6/adenine1519-N6)-dimethyltransferase